MFKLYLLIGLLIVVQCMILGVLVFQASRRVEKDKQGIEEEVIQDIMDNNLPLNAKWVKVFKQQLRSQRFVDKQYRNGVLTLYVNDEHLEYSIDQWILRRLRSYSSNVIYSFLEVETGYVVKGIKISKSKTTRSKKWARKLKRVRPTHEHYYEYTVDEIYNFENIKEYLNGDIETR